MATLDEIGQEKQRISERLARLDGERTKLGDQLNELEIAERILCGRAVALSPGVSSNSPIWPPAAAQCRDGSA
jgi:hypothetical protein